MSIIIKRAVRLALIVEAASCIGAIFQTEPYGFWDKLCEAVGWSPFAVSEALTGFFVLLNFPTVFLFHYLFANHVLEVRNGRLLISPEVIMILLIQGVLWSLVFYGVLRLMERLKPVVNSKS